MVTANHVEHRNDLWNARPVRPPTSLGTPQSCGLFDGISLPWIHYQYNRRAYPSTMIKPRARDIRPARPSYSEEQKFFIMYYRVIKKLPWCEIEDKFTTFFDLRAKNGIISVYYRIRKNWKMKDVLKLKTGDAELDRKIVEDKASLIPHEFLARLGYFEDLNTPRDMDSLPHTGAAGSPVRSIVDGHSPIQLGPSPKHENSCCCSESILARSASSARA